MLMLTFTSKITQMFQFMPNKMLVFHITLDIILFLSLQCWPGSFRSVVSIVSCSRSRPLSWRRAGFLWCSWPGSRGLSCRTQVSLVSSLQSEFAWDSTDRLQSSSCRRCLDLHISHKHAPRRSVERRVREKVDMTRDEEAEQGHMGSRGMAQRHRRLPSSPSSAPAGSSADFRSIGRKDRQNSHSLFLKPDLL